MERGGGPECYRERLCGGRGGRTRRHGLRVLQELHSHGTGAEQVIFLSIPLCTWFVLLHVSGTNLARETFSGLGPAGLGRVWATFSGLMTFSGLGPSRLGPSPEKVDAKFFPERGAGQNKWNR